MKKGVLIGIIAAVAITGGIFTVRSCKFIDTGKVGIVYNLQRQEFRKKHFLLD